MNRLEEARDVNETEMLQQSGSVWLSGVWLFKETVTLLLV